MLRIAAILTLADLIENLGVAPQRILFRPAPGTATEPDVLDFDDHEDRLVELFDGVLVEKAMGFEESIVGCAIVFLLTQHVRPRKLGVVAGSDGMVRYREGVVQLADVAFFSWDRFPEGKLTGDAISGVTPNIAIEVLSRSNTPAEMERKRNEYFDAGVTLVWIVDHRARTVQVYTDAETFVTLQEDDTLNGGNVLPEFQVSVNELFADLPERPA
jgi:Uma2 family endonuclease